MTDFTNPQNGTPAVIAGNAYAVRKVFIAVGGVFIYDSDLQQNISITVPNDFWLEANILAIYAGTTASGILCFL
jgi:hypothetical protein